MALLGLVVVVADLRSELDLLDVDRRLVLPRLLCPLLLLVAPLAVVHDARHGSKCGLGEHVAQFPQERDCAQEFLPGQQEIGRSECVRR